MPADWRALSRDAGWPLGGNLGTSNLSIDFFDLKSQYRSLKTSINDRIQAVLDHGQYIMGPEVGELENRLTAFVGRMDTIQCAVVLAKLERFD
jgi:dTDP-4-amino-4,6-dideoxygalactose transaminase